MAIVNISPIHAYIVETDQDEYYMYTRYSSDQWTVRMGESEEPVYDCEEIERQFQEYIKCLNK